MTEQQKHLLQLLEQQKTLVDDINKLSSELTLKREISLKIQGAIEYLHQIGITLPEKESEENEEEIEDK